MGVGSSNGEKMRKVSGSQIMANLNDRLGILFLHCIMINIYDNIIMHHK